MGPVSGILARDIREECTLSAGDRSRLEAVVADHNSPAKARLASTDRVLAAEGLGTAAIMRHSDKSKYAVNRWRERFQDGIHLRRKIICARTSVRFRAASSISIERASAIGALLPVADDGRMGEDAPLRPSLGASLAVSARW
jgi:hypothetical protein